MGLTNSKNMIAGGEHFTDTIFVDYIDDLFYKNKDIETITQTVKSTISNFDDTEIKYIVNDIGYKHKNDISKMKEILNKYYTKKINLIIICKYVLNSLEINLEKSTINDNLYTEKMFNILDILSTLCEEGFKDSYFRGNNIKVSSIKYKPISYHDLNQTEKWLVKELTKDIENQSYDRTVAKLVSWKTSSTES